MERDARTFLWDVCHAADRIEAFLQGRALADYLADSMLRSAVERQFEIIGEALNRLSRMAPDIAARIPDLARAVAMRNILIHGYAQVDSTAVWRTAHENLPDLRAQAAAALEGLGNGS